MPVDCIYQLTNRLHAWCESKEIISHEKFIILKIWTESLHDDRASKRVTEWIDHWVCQFDLIPAQTWILANVVFVLNLSLFPFIFLDFPDFLVNENLLLYFLVHEFLDFSVEKVVFLLNFFYLFLQFINVVSVLYRNRGHVVF